MRFLLIIIIIISSSISSTDGGWYIYPLFTDPDMETFFISSSLSSSALLHSVSLWYLGDETECRVGTPYIDRNFINSLPKAKVDQSESGFLQKTHLGYVPGPQKFFLAPFHNFLAPNWGVFFKGGHFVRYVGRMWEMWAEELLSPPTVIIIQCWYICLCEICGQNVKNVGRRAVVFMFSEYW